MSECLVTGAAGFIGSSLAETLLAAGHRVRGVDNFSTGQRANLAGLGAMRFLEGDLAVAGIAREACRGIEIVFHQAAIPSVPRSVADPVASNRANVDATVELLVAAHAAGVRRIVYAASSSAYGNHPTLPKREDFQPAPVSPYAVAKLAGEYYMRCFHAVHGLETVCLRYFNVFGPRQDPSSPYSGVLAKFITLMLAGQSPTLHGDGEQSRDFTYIDNVVRANLLAATAPAERAVGKVFNIALGERITLNQVVAMLRPLTGFGGELRREPSRAGDVKHSLADITAAREALGYRPEVSFAAGLERTVAWYRGRAASGSATPA